MAHFKTRYRILLRSLANGTLSPEDADPDDVESLLAQVTSTAATLQEAIEMIAGTKKVMLNQRVDVTEEEEMFLMENGAAPEHHHLFRGYADHPRILTLEEIEAQAFHASGPREKLAVVLTSPSDLAFLTFLTAAKAPE